MALNSSNPNEDAAGLSAANERKLMLGDVVRDAAGAPRVGVLPAHTGVLVSATASMAYSAGAFNAVTARTAAGVEKVANDGATSVATTAAPPSNKRIDVIWVRARFPSLGDTAGQVTPLFGVTQGTAAASPTKPAIPAGALELATAEIPSTATATNSAGVVITQTYPMTAAAGGTVLLRNAVEMAAWTPADGALAYRLDDATGYERVSGAWRARNVSGVVAKMCKTDGFQVVGSGGGVVTGMTAQILTAGYFTVASGVLTVVQAGLYEVSVLVYGSGGDLNNITVGFNASGLAPDAALPVASLKRTDTTVDEVRYVSAPVNLTAGQQLRLVANPQSGSPSIYGAPTNQGASTSFAVRALRLT